MNDYQAANLLGLLSKSSGFNNGDWFGELMHEAAELLRKDTYESGRKPAEPFKVANNFGDEITITEFTTEINGHTWSA